MIRPPAWTVLAGLALGACTPPESATTLTVGPRSTEPEMRVGLSVGLATATISGSGALAVTDPGGRPRAELGAGGQVTVTAVPGGYRLAGGLSWEPAPGDTLIFTSITPDGFVRLGTKEYRGSLLVYAGRNGITVVNRLGMESYLAGVVSAEMGRRDSSEMEALKAQAVISRTYALRNRGRWAALGFDLYATVSDQVYGGVGSETALGWQAVRETGGLVVQHGGSPIDGFFYSTCGGMTARGTEVFAAADRPYLVSIADTDPSGSAYCRISPRFDWRAEWSGEGLREILRESVPTALGASVASRAVIQSIRVGERSPSGRVATLLMTIDGRQLSASGGAVRQVLRPSRGELLRSSVFTLSETVSRGSLTRLVAEGHGAGHGVGMCQWGAVGRSRAGQGHAEILAAYFPHTELERYY